MAKKVEGMLSSYRVLDLTNENGFLCGKILADLGADVIKVERPGGDPSRNVGPFYHDEPHPEKSLLWWAYNTSKRGITLDLTTKGGRETFLNLVRKSDFVIESFMPGHMAKLGLSYAELSNINSRIIMTSISGFGQDGPYARYKAPDIVCSAISGYMNLLGDPDRPPIRITIPQAYLHAANDAAVGSLIALWYRETTGLGQWVDVSAQECMAWQTFNSYVYWDFQGLNRKRGGPFGSLPSGRIMQSVYPCKDGYVLLTATRGRDGRRTRRLVEWMEEEGMANDSLREVDWGTNPSVTDLSEEEVEQLIEQAEERTRSFGPFLLSKTKKELFEQAISRGILLAPIN
jgi:benzylsuccinate CoA-transferase BbsE subunit